MNAIEKLKEIGVDANAAPQAHPAKGSVQLEQHPALTRAAAAVEKFREHDGWMDFHSAEREKAGNAYCAALFETMPFKVGDIIRPPDRMRDTTEYLVTGFERHGLLTLEITARALVSRHKLGKKTRTFVLYDEEWLDLMRQYVVVGTGALMQGGGDETIIRDGQTPAPKTQAAPKGDIGKTQYDVLHSLAGDGRDGVWHANCGWVWGGLAETERLMESLVRRGLVEKIEHAERRTRYKITQAGRDRLAQPAPKERVS